MKLDDTTRAGLKLIYNLARADVQCAEDGDFTPEEREQLACGFTYLQAVCGFANLHKKGSKS